MVCKYNRNKRCTDTTSTANDDLGDAPELKEEDLREEWIAGGLD
ncbi:unnamed protein product, partial [Choristocarpus tenellus]